MLRWLKRLIVGSLLLAVTGALAYAFTDGFTQRCRQFVTAKFEERGVHLDFARFGLSLVDGLVVRDVHVFGDSARQQLLMSMDRLNLDIDYGRLIQKQFFIEGLELSDTSVSLPLDPTKGSGDRLDLKRFTSRVYFMDDRVEIRRAEGDLAGIHIMISGTLKLPQKRSEIEKKDPKDPKAKTPFVLTREHREMIQKGLRWLERFTFGQRPIIALDIDGSLDEPDDLRATVRLNARRLGYEQYVCEELSGTVEYHDHLLDIRRLTMRDHLGVFEASAIWPLEADEVQFTVNTTTDLPQLARSFFQNEELREVVFYETAPSMTLEGKWFVRGPKATPRRPVEALGQIKFGRFTTRGEVFDGLSANFGVSPSGYYVRDALLRHKTGTLSLQAMSRDIEGFKYRAVLRMDPHAFLPFAGTDAAREMIKRFEFQEHSTIFVELEGEGTSAAFADCRNVGRVELRDFKYQGIDFNACTGDVEMFNSKQVFRNVELHPRVGHAFASEVLVDGENRIVKLTGVRAKVDPVPITSCFARTTAEMLAKYRFSPETEIELDGVIGIKGLGKDDYSIRFKSEGETAVYPLWQRNYEIKSPVGSLSIVNGKLSYDIKGRLFGGPMTASGHVQFGKAGGYDLKLQADEFRHVVLGKDLAFRGVNVDLTSKADTTPFDISASVLGGAMTLKGMFDYSGKADSYRGELRLNGLPFRQFAGVYAPGNESEGDITGHFDFSGRPNDWKALKGSGVIIILNGNLYALPVLGPLTPLLGAVLPSVIKDYNVAKEANCNFTVADGFLITKDFEALTSAFKLVADGRIDFINDDIDFTVQARARGLPGLVLRPVSELLTYKGTGPPGKPEWRPHLLGLSKDRDGTERRPPTQAELEAAQQEVQKVNDLRERLKRLPLRKP